MVSSTAMPVKTESSKAGTFRLRFQVVYKQPRKADLRVFVVGNIVELGSTDQEKMRKNLHKFDVKIRKQYQKFKENKEAEKVKKEELNDNSSDVSEDSDDGGCDGPWFDNSELLQFEDFFNSYFLLLQQDPDDTGIEDLWSTDGHVTISSVAPGKKFVYSYYIYDFDTKRICSGDKGVNAREVTVPEVAQLKRCSEWTVRDKKVNDMSFTQFKPSSDFDDVELDDEDL